MSITNYTSVRLIFIFVCITQVAYAISPKKTIHIMLDPAGDSNKPGRLIDTSFERTCTLFFANQIKYRLEKKDARIKIFFSRLPGEQTSQLEKARLCNACDVQLFCHISAFTSQQIKPEIYIYYPYSKLIFPSKKSFIRFEDAHHKMQEQTNKIADAFYQEMQPHQRLCTPFSPVSCALQTTKGITCPALCLEFGIKSPDELCNLIDPCTEALYNIIKQHLHQQQEQSS